MKTVISSWNIFFNNKDKYHNLCISFPVGLDSHAKEKLIPQIKKLIIEEIKKSQDLQDLKFTQSDFLNYTEKDDPLSVTDLDEMDKFLSYKSTYLPCKIVLINGLFPLTTIVSNKLLKYLEEPPVPASFILIGPSPTSLLPTVKSRFLNFRLNLIDCLNMLNLNDYYPISSVNIFEGWKKLNSSIELEQWAESHGVDLNGCLDFYWNLASPYMKTYQEIERFLTFKKWNEQSDIWNLPQAERWYFLFQMIKSKIQSITM